MPLSGIGETCLFSGISGVMTLNGDIVSGGYITSQCIWNVELDVINTGFD